MTTRSWQRDLNSDPGSEIAKRHAPRVCLYCPTRITGARLADDHILCTRCFETAERERRAEAGARDLAREALGQ